MNTGLDRVGLLITVSKSFSSFDEQLRDPLNMNKPWSVKLALDQATSGNQLSALQRQKGKPKLEKLLSAPWCQIEKLISPTR